MVSIYPNPDRELYFFDPMITGLNSQLPANTVAPPPPTATSLSNSSAGNTTGNSEDLKKKIRKPYTITKSRESWTEQEHGLNSQLPANTVAPPPPTATSLSNSSAGNTTGNSEDLKKEIRKPYTITKSTESWTEQEHDKFLEALQLFDRDWKKIEAFIGSKTVIQIRSHAQKYFLKVQKSGTSEHVPPPRPKRKAAHPYPQKAPKNAHVMPQVPGPFQSSPALLESGYTCIPDSSSMLGNPIGAAALSSWSYNSVPPVIVSQVTKDDAVLAGPTFANNSCYSSSNETIPRTWSFGETIDRGDRRKQSRVMLDFAEVYSFIGSVFDPSETGHLLKLKQMDPINLETVSLLMRNLSVNLRSPEFEDHRRLLSMYDAGSNGVKLGSSYNGIHSHRTASAVSTA